MQEKHKWGHKEMKESCVTLRFELSTKDGSFFNVPISFLKFNPAVRTTRSCKRQ